LELDGDTLQEIKLLRAFVYRISGMLDGKIVFDEDGIALARLMTTMCTAIGNLTTRRAFETGKITDVQAAITEAIIEKGPISFPHLIGRK